MRIVIQRVSHAVVTVEEQIVGEIAKGLLVLLGIEKTDLESDADYLVNKTAGLRIFADKSGVMNLNVCEAGGSLLVVSQFTLYGDCRKGMRPSYDRAEKPERARSIYEYFVSQAKLRVERVETGIFQASMQVKLTNDGPVTLICESR